VYSSFWGKIKEFFFGLNVKKRNGGGFLSLKESFFVSACY